MRRTYTPDPMIPRRYRVLRAWREIDDVVSLELATLEGAPVPFKPGQFNMIYPFGVGEAAISISGDMADPARLIHTTRAVGAVSCAITALAAGDMVGIRGPFGAHWPIQSQQGRNIMFVGGGLGLAPLRPAIYHALRHRADYAGLAIVYGARSPASLVYADEIQSWKSRFDTEVEVTVDHAQPGWTGRVGVVTTCLDRALAGTEAQAVSAFVCGPEIMMRFAVHTLRAAGVPADRIWVSLERNMKCAIGFCGHCQYGADFVCRDGPVFRYDKIATRLAMREI